MSKGAISSSSTLYVDEKYELFPSRAQELLNRKVDLILASVVAAAVAASKLTKDVPIVFATSSGDPAKIGLVESIRRPGGNLTGLTLFAPEMTLKHLQLMREIVPNLSRVAVLWNPANDDHPSVVKGAEQTAKSLNLDIVPVGARGPGEFAAAFATIEKANVGGLIVLVDSMLRVNRKPIIDFVSRASIACDLSHARLRRVRRTDGLWRLCALQLQAIGEIHCRHSEGREAGRHAGRAAVKIRHSGESQDGKGAEYRLSRSQFFFGPTT